MSEERLFGGVAEFPAASYDSVSTSSSQDEDFEISQNGGFNMDAQRAMHQATVGEVEAATRKAWKTLKGKGKNMAAVGLILSIKFSLQTALVRSGTGSADCRQLRHQFLLLRHQGAVVIVDTYFRDQFELGRRQDTEYASFLAHEVPEVFVGTPATLVAMLRVVCRMMHGALARLGLTVPPWRQTAAIMSKWAPSQYTDERIAVPSSLAEDSSPGVPATAANAGRREAADCRQPETPSTLRVYSEPRMVVRGFSVSGPTRDTAAAAAGCASTVQQVPQLASRRGLIIPSDAVEGGGDTSLRRHLALPLSSSHTSQSTACSSSSFSHLLVRSMSERGCCSRVEEQRAEVLAVLDAADTKQGGKEPAVAQPRQLRRPHSAVTIGEDRITAAVPQARQKGVPLRLFRPLQDLLPHIRTVKCRGSVA